MTVMEKFKLGSTMDVMEKFKLGSWQGSMPSMRCLTLHSWFGLSGVNYLKIDDENHHTLISISLLSKDHGKRVKYQRMTGNEKKTKIECFLFLFNGYTVTDLMDDYVKQVVLY